MENRHGRISAETSQAIAELLAAAEQYNLGVLFEPDANGWRVNYVIHDWPAWQESEWKGGELSNAYDLQVAASAALKPLVEMGERASAYFGSRKA